MALWACMAVIFWRGKSKRGVDKILARAKMLVS